MAELERATHSQVVPKRPSSLETGSAALLVVHLNDPCKVSFRAPVILQRQRNLVRPFFHGFVRLFFCLFSRSGGPTSKPKKSQILDVPPRKEPYDPPFALIHVLDTLSLLYNTFPHCLIRRAFNFSHAWSPVRILCCSHPQGQGSPIWHPFSRGNRASHFPNHILSRGN